MAFGFGTVQGTPLTPLAGLQQWVDPRRNTLLALGAGLASGTDLGSGVAKALQLAVSGKQADDAYATSKKEEAARQQQLNKTVEYLRRVAPNYADAVDAGALSPSDAYKQYLQDQKGTGPAPLMDLSPGATIYDPNTRQPIFTAPQEPRTPSLPTSFQEYQLAQQNPGYAAALNSSTSKPPTDAKVRGEALYAVVKPDAALLLGDGTNGGVFDALTNIKDQALGGNIAAGPLDMGRPGMGLTSQDYQRATNAIGNIAQSYLYAISGQAAPASEVAKIIESVTPKPFENEVAVREKRDRLAQYVEAIRIAAERGVAAPTTQTNPSGQTSTGLPWKVVQ